MEGGQQRKRNEDAHEVLVVPGESKKTLVYKFGNNHLRDSLLHDDCSSGINPQEFVKFKDNIFIVETNYGNTKLLCCGYKLNKTWKTLVSLSTSQHYNSTVIKYKEVILILGGEISNSVTNTVSCFVPTINKWVSLPDMKKARSHVTAVVHCNDLYVIGGKDKYSIKDAEIYSTSADSWEELPNLNECRYVNPRPNHIEKNLRCWRFRQIPSSESKISGNISSR